MRSKLLHFSINKQATVFVFLSLSSSFMKFRMELREAHISHCLLSTFYFHRLSAHTSMVLPFLVSYSPSTKGRVPPRAPTRAFPSPSPLSSFFFLHLPDLLLIKTFHHLLSPAIDSPPRHGFLSVRPPTGLTWYSVALMGIMEVMGHPRYRPP